MSLCVFLFVAGGAYGEELGQKHALLTLGAATSDIVQGEDPPGDQATPPPKKPLRLRLVLTKNTWRSPWFQLFCITALILCLAIVYFSRTTLHRRRQRQLEALVQLRTQDLERLKEEAEVANMAKSQFLKSMSHELRTPLTGVTGMASLLSRTELSPQQREYAEAIQASSGSLLAIINDLLDMAKLEANNLETEHRPVEVAAVVGFALRSVPLPDHKRHLELQRHIDDDVPRWILGDFLRLRQILLNLVANAVKFTERGRVSIHVSFAAGRLTFSVADTGIGIPESKLDSLFKPFTQVDASLTRRYGGAGLGLAICDQLVEHMGGTIAVESREGKGSTFTFTIPATPTEGPSGLNGRRPPAPLEADFRILVVEDDATTQTVLRHELTDLGLRCRVADNGREALDLYRQERFALILMDCDLPELDGFQTTAEIRRREATTGDHTPIVALTASALQGDRDRCLEAGMDDYLTKPFQSDDLAGVLRRWLTTSVEPEKS